ncbi:AI-2E family transporter [Halobacteria archaeon AArc-dxtr1]|nr:AI-2E family transporter [Halobacteria archaeon AArc-dxtr1]
MNRSIGYLLALILAFGYLSLQVVLPFLQYVLLAVLLAYVLAPLQRRLEERVSSTIAALSLVSLAVVAVVVPIVAVIAAVADDAARLAEDLDPEAVGIADFEEQLEAELGIDVNLAEHAATAGQEVGTAVFEQSAAWFSAATHALIGLGLALFLLYYLLKAGDSLYAWLRDVTPLPADVQDDLYGQVDEVTRAVLLGHVLIAIIEGAIAGIGLFVTGIPNAAFWTAIMIVLSLIPLIGAFVVWGPAVLYLLVTGEPLLAVGLFVYSAIVVGISDDYLRPIVVDRYADLSPAVIIIGVLGGIYAFGIMGLFFGPVIVGAFVAIVEVADEHYDRLGGEEAEGV